MLIKLKHGLENQRTLWRGNFLVRVLLLKGGMYPGEYSELLVLFSCPDFHLCSMLLLLNFGNVLQCCRSLAVLMTAFTTNVFKV